MVILIVCIQFFIFRYVPTLYTISILVYNFNVENLFIFNNTFYSVAYLGEVYSMLGHRPPPFEKT